MRSPKVKGPKSYKPKLLSLGKESGLGRSSRASSLGSLGSLGGLSGRGPSTRPGRKRKM
jgi:hypothetical protein